MSKSSHKKSKITKLQQTQIEKEQIIDRIFQALDIDADGYVSIGDLRSMLKNFSHVHNVNQVIFHILETLDRNRDQRISKEEFQLFKQFLLDHENDFHRQSFENRSNSIFTLFDHNRDNYLSPREIRDTMKNIGETIDDNLLNEMMQTADINHDGRISRDEFKKLLLQLEQR